MTDDPVAPSGHALGRYDDADGGRTAADEPLHEVRLLGLPLDLLMEGREHHAEVMREFAVLALHEELDAEHVPARMLRLIDVLGRRYATTADRPNAEIDAAYRRGIGTIDVVFHVPAHVAEAASVLEQLMTEADEFCRSRQMLTLERRPEQVAFARWYLDEFRRQVAGEPPRPWTDATGEAGARP